MTIDTIIQQWLEADAELEQQRTKANNSFDLQAFYQAQSKKNVITYRMINHPDWTIELQDKYYPQENVVI